VVSRPGLQVNLDAQSTRAAHRGRPAFKWYGEGGRRRSPLPQVRITARRLLSNTLKRNRSTGKRSWNGGHYYPGLLLKVTPPKLRKTLLVRERSA